MSERYTNATLDWLAKWDRCWRCGCPGVWGVNLVCHHMVRGCNRKPNDVRTAVVLCGRCHHEEHNGKSLGLVGCLRLKRRFDRENYDLAAVNELRHRGENAITEEDMAK